jgi:hypothetical protein
VVFYKTPAEAEAAGFRACLRCKPQEEDRDDPQEKAVARACVLIDNALKANDPKAFRLQDLAKSVGLTPRYFHKIFKDKTGLTPKEYSKAKMTKDESVEVMPVAAGGGGQIAFETLGLGDINFGDLVDLDFDPSLAFDDELMRATPELNGTVFGQHVKGNQQLPPSQGTRDPAIPVAGLSIGMGEYAVPVEPFPVSSRQWESCKIITPPISTNELDEAVVLSNSPITGLFDGNIAPSNFTVGMSQDMYQDFVWGTM